MPVLLEAVPGRRAHQDAAEVLRAPGVPTQAARGSWHERNPEYDAARRLRELQRKVQAAGAPQQVVRKEPEPGRRLPADEVQDAIGAQGLDLVRG